MATAPTRLSALDPALRPAGSTRPACVEHAAVFQSPLLEEPLAGGAPVETRRRYNALVQQAEAVCADCPVVAGCLVRAVLDHDVAGYVAGTTARQRGEIRRRLGVTVAPEDFDTLAGVTGRHRQVDHDEVVRLRTANPHESLETLAHRLGCSLSTVKRHLRRERHEPTARGPEAPRPSTLQVLTAARSVLVGSGVRRSAA